MQMDEIAIHLFAQKVDRSKEERLSQINENRTEFRLRGSPW